MPLRAIYRGQFQGGVIHVNSGGMPLCIARNYPNEKTPWKWAEAEGDITCRRCLEALRPDEKLLVEKQSLKGAIFQ